MFTAARSDARYCSGKCRTTAYRQRHDERTALERPYVGATWANRMRDAERTVASLERLARDPEFIRHAKHGAIRTAEAKALADRLAALHDPSQAVQL